jgi:hypothetical protein
MNLFTLSSSTPVSSFSSWSVRVLLLQHRTTSLNMSQIDTSLLQNLDDAARQNVLSFIQSESAKAKIQTSVTQFTDRCFKKCVSAPITNDALSGAEQTCMADCVNRFLDTNIRVLHMLQATQR